MDFTFNEEQDILRESARRFVEKECSTDYVKLFVDGETTFTEEMWQKIAELGWTAVLIPEEYGGLGLNFVDLAVILEEMGKGPMPGPFISSVVLAGEALCLAGNPEQKSVCLPKMATGERRGTLAWAEPGDLNILINEPFQSPRNLEIYWKAACRPGRWAPGIVVFFQNIAILDF